MAFNGEYEYWFSSSIISSLMNVLKDYCAPGHLAPAICTLFSDMAYVAHQN